MKLTLAFLTFFIGFIGFAQKGTISGVLTDKDANNATLPFANAVIKGTAFGTTTDENGKYSITIAPGNYTIIFSFLGYDNVEIPVTVAAGQTVTINKALGSGSYKLEDVVVKSAVSREKESALLLDQKNATEIKQSIGAQEMARKGVSDVATAVTKTTGVTKQEGSGTIYVRGLGDRYNATTMNGLPIPSNDPEKKNIDLGIFSTDIVEYIAIDKVYGSRIYGDFAGGNVDIFSKDYKGNGFFRIGIGSNAGTNALSKKDFRLQKGQTDFGFSTTKIPQSALTAYNFKTLQLERRVPFAGAFDLATGDSYNIGQTGKLSLFATASFDNGYFSTKNGSAAGGVNQNAIGGLDEDTYYGRKFFKYTSDSYNTTTTGLGNIGYRINSTNKINFNSVFINSSAQSTEEYFGRIVDIADDGDGLTRRSTYTRNELYVNQLLGEHKISDRISFFWGASRNTVKGDMPDRTTNTFNITDSGYFINSESAPNNNRYFQDLKENETAVNATADYKFRKTGEGEFKGKVTIGYNGKFKKRNFNATQFNLDNTNLGEKADPDNLDSFYNQQNFDAGLFSIATFRGGYQLKNALNPQTYDGDQTVHGGFANIEYQFGESFTAVFGLRVENIVQKVTWDTQLDPDEDDGDNENTLDKTVYLPSLTLKYKLNDRQNLRLGASKTYTLPQFKERALFVYEDITEVHVGNPDLYSSDNYNFDLKWEMFPKADELISLTAFGKYIQNPINEVTIASSTNDISYLNTGDMGYVAGGEFEIKKSIFDTGSENATKILAGFNASYMYTEQELDSEKVKDENQTIGYQADFTNDKGKFTGASPLLLNADVTYLKQWQNDKNLGLTLTYTYFSDRVYSIGTNQRGDLVDKAVGTLDFILKSKFNKSMGLDMTVKNIIDPKIDRVQENEGGDVNVLSYKKGLALSLGVNYVF